MSKFSIWIDDNNVSSNCQTPEIFADDSQRKKGFQSGTGASAIRVNTALRQANLIAVALVNALGIPDTYDLTSSLTDIENWFKSTQLLKMSDLFNVATECTIKKTLLPSTTNSIDLGSSTKKFRSIYATTFYGNLSGTANYATSAGSAFDADHADNADNADKVNSLEIKRDVNGVLKIGDTVIITQKKLLWNSNTGKNIDIDDEHSINNPKPIYTHTTSLANKKLEVEVASFADDINNTIVSRQSYVISCKDGYYSAVQYPHEPGTDQDGHVVIGYGTCLIGVNNKTLWGLSFLQSITFTTEGNVGGGVNTFVELSGKSELRRAVTAIYEIIE